MKIHSANDVQTHELKKISDLCQIVREFSKVAVSCR